MKNMFKNSKAITLIALVITIVILIILAGVVISLSLGNNGLFNKAQEAKERYINAQDYEETEIAKSVNKIDEFVNYSRTGSTEDGQPAGILFKSICGGEYPSNDEATTVEVENLTVGKSYLFVCFRAYTGGKNAFIGWNTEYHTCTFSNASSVTQLDETVNCYIVKPSDTSVVVSFPAFEKSVFPEKGAAPYVYAFEI